MSGWASRFAALGERHTSFLPKLRHDARADDVDGLRKAAAEEGLVALYRGLLPRLLLKSVGGAIWYSTYVSRRAALGAPVAAHK